MGYRWPTAIVCHNLRCFLDIFKPMVMALAASLSPFSVSGGVGSSSARMEVLMDLFEFAVFDLGVDLSGFDACVTEHFLDQSQVCTAGEQVGSEAMSKSVRASFWVDSYA